MTGEGLTAPAAAALAAGGAFAVADWWAVSQRGGRARLEYLAKPATLLALLVTAALVNPPAGEGVMRAWFVPALALCLAGDVLLMLPGERRLAFAGGLGAFLGAHVCFLVGLAVARATLGAALVAGAVLALLAAAPIGAVLRGVARRLGAAMVGPVAVYVAALVAMAGAAWSAALARHPAGTDPLLAVGGTLFVVSDTLLAVDRFVRSLPRAKLAVHVTYHLAVVALVVALA